jgi:hypothetical protein
MYTPYLFGPSWQLGQVQATLLSRLPPVDDSVGDGVALPVAAATGLAANVGRAIC